MASFDDFARLCTDEIRTAANLDRAAKLADQSNPEVVNSNIVAALKSIANLLSGMRVADQQRITELTAQRLGLDPSKLQNAFRAVATNSTLVAVQDIQYLIDHAT